SDIFDAHTFSRWGRAEFRGIGNVQLFARSGNVDNPDRNWSPWNPVDMTRNGSLPVPPARFVQWKAVLRSGNPAPRVECSDQLPAQKCRPGDRGRDGH